MDSTSEHPIALDYGKSSKSPLDASVVSPCVSRGQWILLALILAAAVAIRFTGIERMSVFMDEVWVVELAMGHGPVHEELKFDRLYTDVVPPTRLSSAGPALDIFRQVKGITHPPGYVFALRLWCNLFGTRDMATRGFSVFASVLAILVLFDVVRRLYGTKAAIFSSLIMALAGPQVELAQEVRPYCLLTLMSLLCADVLLVINRTRPAGTAPPDPSDKSRYRWLLVPLLATLVFLTMVTHYFALGVMLGLGMYTVFVMKGRPRQIALAGYAIAAIVFSCTWLPYMLDQRDTVRETADNWLVEKPDGHLAKTIERASNVTFRLLIQQELTFDRKRNLSVALILAPFLLLSRRRDLAFPCCWLLGTLGLLVGLDLFRGTKHLELTRYVSIAAPAVYLLPVALTLHLQSRIVRILVPSLVALSCLCALPELTDLVKQRFREAGAYLDKHVQPGDVVVIFNLPAEPFYSRVTWLSLAHYSNKYPWPFLLVSGEFNEKARDQLIDAKSIWVVAPPGRYPPDSIVPGATPRYMDYFHRFGEIYQLPNPTTKQSQ